MQGFYVCCVAYTYGIGEPNYFQYFEKYLEAHDATDAEWAFANELLTKVEWNTYLDIYVQLAA